MPRDLEQARLNAYFRETGAELDVLQAQAEGRKAQEEMTEILSLDVLREDARQKLAAIRQHASDAVTAVKHDVEAELHEIEVGIERVRDRYGEWNDARERRFNALLDEVEAKLRLWKARADYRSAALGFEAQSALASLEERTSLAKACAAEWNSDRHNVMVQEALADAARRLDDAFDAASKTFGE